MATVGCSIQSAAAVAQRRQVAPECAKKFEKTVMCRYFPKCSRSKDCMYAHSEGELRRRPNMTKTRMCVGYLQGRCPYPSSECQFAHGPEDLLNADGEHVAPGCRAETAKLGMWVVPPGLELLTPTNSGTATPVSRLSRHDFSSNSSGASTPPTPPTLLESDGIALLAALAWHMSDSEERLGPNAMGLDEELRVLARLRL